MTHPQPLLFAARAVPLGDHAVRVEVEGELDLATAPQLDELLRREVDAGHKITLDLSRLTFMDSSGLHAIITAFRSASLNGAQVRVGGSLLPQIRRLIEITGLQDVLSPDHH